MQHKTWNLSIFLAYAVFLYKADAQITGWTVPSGSGADVSGTLTFPENQATGATTTTFAATPTGSDTISSYTLLTASVPFSVASGTGVLSLDSALDYETTTSYTLQIRAVDSASNSGTATITVTVTNVYDVAPVFAKTQYATTIPDASTQGTAVITVTATDVEAGDTLSYSITAGDTGSHFKISSSGAITVNTGVTLSASTLAGYSLTVTAEDSGANTHTTTVWIAVLTCSSAASVVVAGMLTLFAALITKIL